MTSEAWYKGTADAVYQNANIIKSYGRIMCSSWRVITSIKWITA